LNYILDVNHQIGSDSKGSQWICLACTEKLYQCFEFTEKVRENEVIIGNSEDITDLKVFLIQEDPEIDVDQQPDELPETATKRKPEPEELEAVVVQEEPKRAKTSTKKSDSQIPRSIVVPKFSFSISTPKDPSEDSMESIHEVHLNITSQKIDFSPYTDFSFLEDASKDETDIMYTCKYCPRAFTSAYHLLQHVRNTHLCALCLTCFKKFPDLCNHVKSFHINVSCPFCDRVSPNSSSFRNHLKKTHSVNLPANISVVPIEASEKLVLMD
jgi:hypothetical protein